MEGRGRSRLMATSFVSLVLLLGASYLPVGNHCAETALTPSTASHDLSDEQWARDLLLGLEDVTSNHHSHLAADAARDRARDIAQDLHLLEAHGVVEDPLLVWDTSLRPSYFIVPLRDPGGQTLLGLNASTGAWQWYSRAAKDFPQVLGEEAEALVLALEGDVDPKIEPFVVTTPLKKLFWVVETAAGYYLINIDDPEDVMIASRHADDVLTSGPSPQPTGRPASPRTASGDSTGILQSHDIPVPFHFQETSWYCGEAALQMIFDYYGPLISQDDIGDVANEVEPWGTYGDDVRRAAHFSYMSAAVQDAGLRGYNERKLGYGAFEEWWSWPNETADPDFSTRYADLKDLILADNPLILLTFYDESHTVGHFRVLKGFDDNTHEFIVHDPWYSLPYGGPDVHFNQTFLVDDLWLRWYRWALFVSPWVVNLTHPAGVMQGEIFNVTTYIEYKAPHPYEGSYWAENSTAIFGLPPGGETYGYDNEQPLSITVGGTWDTVTWQVFSRNAGTFNFTVNASGTVEGSTWYSYPYYQDRIGNIESGSLIVAPDGVSPSISILTPLDGSTINKSKVWVSWTGSDNVRIDRYEFRLDSGNWTDLGTSTHHNITSLDMGWHTVDVMAYDPAGHFASDSVSFNYTYRPPRPPTDFTAELSGDGSENVTLTWQLSPDDGQSFMSVISYLVFRNLWYNEEGAGYSLLGVAPNGTNTYVDAYAGEGDPWWHYFYRVCALDTNGTSVCASDQAGKFARPLMAGPNLVSVPLVQANESPETVLQCGIRRGVVL